MSNTKEILKSKIKSGRKTAHDLLIESDENTIKEKNNLKFEDRFTRKTYYIENELLEFLNRFTGNEKGEKTKIINEALRRYFKTI